MTASNDNYTTYCPHGTLIQDIQSLQTTVTGIVGVIENIEYETGCTIVQQVAFEVFNSALCTDMYTGIFFFWGSMLLTNFFMFMAILVASYVWQYYIFWNGVPVTEPNHDFDQVNLDDDKDSDEENGDDVVQNPERDTFLEREHSTTVANSPYSDPDAHMVAPHEVVEGTVVAVYNDPADGDIAMVPVVGTANNKKKSPKKMKNNNYTVVNGNETDTQI